MLARRDRYAAARDRFHAKSDRAAARLDRVVSANERVESSIDGLTGAYRRDAGLLELEHEVTRAQRTGDTFVLAFVDVNNLKESNDLHGHIAGDRLLRKIADTLRANVRSYDLVVRYGGDEFICGFPALDVNDAAERFARINEDLAASDEASVAFGLAELERGDSLTDLITKADSPDVRQPVPAHRGSVRSPPSPTTGCRLTTQPTGTSPGRRRDRARHRARRPLPRAGSATSSSTSVMVSRGRVRADLGLQGAGPRRIGGFGPGRAARPRQPGPATAPGAQVDARARTSARGPPLRACPRCRRRRPGARRGPEPAARRRSRRWSP